MIRRLAAIAALLCIFASARPSAAQAPNRVSIANASSTGTTLSKLTKVTGAPSKAVIASTSDTGGIVGITIAGAGTTGNAIIQITGIASCVFDGATTAGDYVQISSTTGGDCHDAGSSYPATGEIIGRVLSTNGSGGTYSLLLADEVEPGGATTGVTSVTDASPIAWNLGSSLYVTGRVQLNHATGTRALNISNPVDGGIYTLIIDQDGTGGAALTLGSGCTWKVGGGGSGAITLSSAASSRDVLVFLYRSSDTTCNANFNANFN